VAPGTLEFDGTDRFEVEQRLGAGGFGVVYRVRDRQRQGRVALKTLDRVNPDTLYRFRAPRSSPRSTR